MPVTKAKDPDLTPVRSATKTVGKHLRPGAIVVPESTVYPGVTDEILVPVQEQAYGLVYGTFYFRRMEQYYADIV